MLDILNEQYKSGKAFTQSKYREGLSRFNFPAFYHELHPATLDYYHEFNPHFTFCVPRAELFNFAKTFTVRDGHITFADFLLKNAQIIPHLKTKFIIHESFASLVPANLTENFLLWSITQSRKTDPKKAKKVFISGLMSEQYVCSIDEMTKRLSFLENVPSDTKIELFLPNRKNPFEPEWKDLTLSLDYVSALKDLMPNREMNFLNYRDFLEKSDFSSHLCVDLADDLALVSDNYVQYFAASKGGSIHSFAQAPTKKSLFSIELGLTHQFNIHEFTQKESCFADLLFYKKKASGDLLADVQFHQLLKTVLNQKL